jgi:type II pantothenate kinase
MASEGEPPSIPHPGDVLINVKGAFIVGDDVRANGGDGGSGGANSDGPTVSREHHETKDIRLPNHTAVVSHVAIDIGGSLAKLVFFSREPGSAEPGGRLNFVKFETDKIDAGIEFMRQLQREQRELNQSKQSELCVMATGGGAFKYYEKIREALGVKVLREDEMECLIVGKCGLKLRLAQEIKKINVG